MRLLQIPGPFLSVTCRAVAPSKGKAPPFCRVLRAVSVWDLADFRSLYSRPLPITVCCTNSRGMNQDLSPNSCDDEVWLASRQAVDTDEGELASQQGKRRAAPDDAEEGLSETEGTSLLSLLSCSHGLMISREWLIGMTRDSVL